MTDALPQSTWEDIAELMARVDSNMPALAAITQLPFEDVTPELWEHIQTVVDKSGDLLSVLKYMITMGSKMMSNDALAAHSVAVAAALDD